MRRNDEAGPDGQIILEVSATDRAACEATVDEELLVCARCIRQRPVRVRLAFGAAAVAVWLLVCVAPIVAVAVLECLPPILRSAHGTAAVAASCMLFGVGGTVTAVTCGNEAFTK